MEVEEHQQQQFAVKRTADGDQKPVALACEEAVHRFAHFDVDTEDWFLTDRVSNGQRIFGFCYRCRNTGRPVLIVPSDDNSHYILYIQVRADNIGGTKPVGFLVSPGEDIGSRMLEHMREARDTYKDLGELQVVAYEEVDEAEQTRFLNAIKRAVTINEILSEYQAQLPVPQTELVPQPTNTSRRLAKGRRRLGNRK